MLPNGGVSSTYIADDFLDPDIRPRPNKTTDYELGGIAINDPSSGLQYQVWVARLVGTSVQCYPESGSPVTELLNAEGITEISLAFDQNMRPALAYVQDSVTKLQWYDSTISSQTTTTFAGVTSPKICLDDKRALQVGNSDILFFYIKEGSIYYRQQRDRYGVEYLFSVLPEGTTRISTVGMNVGNRIQLMLR